MALISGASQFLGASTLANKNGTIPQLPNLLDGTGFNLLEAGRRINRTGLGLSANARALNQQFLSQTSGLFNNLFSAEAEANTVENMQKQILAKRASLPASALPSGRLKPRSDIRSP